MHRKVISLLVLKQFAVNEHSFTTLSAINMRRSSHLSLMGIAAVSSSTRWWMEINIFFRLLCLYHHIVSFSVHSPKREGNGHAMDFTRIKLESLQNLISTSFLWCHFFSGGGEKLFHSHDIAIIFYQVKLNFQFLKPSVWKMCSCQSNDSKWEWIVWMNMFEFCMKLAGIIGESLNVIKFLSHSNC